MALRVVAIALFVFLVNPTSLVAQSFEVSGHFASSRWSEFDGSDNGFGGRLTWNASSMIGVDAEVTWYPAGFTDSFSFSRRRVEGLFGATIGPRIDRVRPFAKVAAGFLNVAPTSGGFACIAIFPPPLPCVLAGGDTLPAVEFGGGLIVDATDRTFVRFDVSDRMLKYPGPTFDDNFEIRDQDFFGHALRLTLGAGVRF